MNRFLMGLTLVACTFLTGCDNSPERGTVETTTVDETNTDDGDKGGISIKLPGVEINVDEEKGVDVKAPGTDVSVRKDGIDITAPNVDIKARPGAEPDQ